MEKMEQDSTETYLISGTIHSKQLMNTQVIYHEKTTTIDVRNLKQYDGMLTGKI